MYLSHKDIIALYLTCNDTKKNLDKEDLLKDIMKKNLILCEKRNSETLTFSYVSFLWKELEDTINNDIKEDYILSLLDRVENTDESSDFFIEVVLKLKTENTKWDNSKIYEKIAYRGLDTLLTKIKQVLEISTCGIVEIVAKAGLSKLAFELCNMKYPDNADFKINVNNQVISKINHDNENSEKDVENKHNCETSSKFDSNNDSDEDRDELLTYIARGASLGGHENLLKTVLRTKSKNYEWLLFSDHLEDYYFLSGGFKNHILLAYKCANDLEIDFLKLELKAFIDGMDSSENISSEDISCDDAPKNKFRKGITHQTLDELIKLINNQLSEFSDILISNVTTWDSKLMDSFCRLGSKMYVFDCGDEDLQLALIMLYHTIHPFCMSLPRNLNKILEEMDQNPDYIFTLSFEELQVLKYNYKNQDTLELVNELMVATTRMQEIYTSYYAFKKSGSNLTRS
jgi:hypothetical protein